LSVVNNFNKQKGKNLIEETIKKFTRRLVNYMHKCSLEEKIAAADFLNSITEEDNLNKNLLKVPKILRNQI